MTETPERFGPYELVSLVGRGGMGEVYRAYDTVRRRTVALKRLPRHLAGDPDYEVRFRREAEVAARLTEPHIIPIHDYGEINGQLYIDMRLITGVDLAGVIEQDGPLAPARAVAVIGQVATALAAAHAEGLVHRDVKPSNVLLSTTDRGEDFVHLVDFGIVHEQNSTVLTAAGSTIGTLDYMAPERLQQEHCDHRVDVYSLGCVLYEALTGTKPFVASGPAAKMFAHMNVAPPRPSQSRAGIPPGLDDVVALAMAKDPAQRYSTTTELAMGAFRALSGAPPVGGGPAGPATRIGPGAATTGYGGTRYGPDPTRQTTAATRGAPAPARTAFGPPTGVGPAPGATAATTPAGPQHPGTPHQSPPAAAPLTPRRLMPVLAVAAVVAVAIVVALFVYARPTSGASGTAAASATTAPAAGSAAGSTVAAQAQAGGTQAGAAAPAAGAPVAGAPAAGATTAVTTAQGSRTLVQTSSLQLCSGDGVSLTSGQMVDTTSISRIDVTAAGATDTSVTITQTGGQRIDGKVNYGCTVTGQSSIGPFSLELGKVRSVEIGR